MQRYRFFHHTADAKFQAYGKNIEEAFLNAALATASLMWDWDKIEKRIDYQIEVDGIDLFQLLYNFLEEILFLLDTEAFLLGAVCDVKIEEKDGRYFLCTLFAGDIYSEMYEVSGDVKAVTYSDMKIETGGGYAVVQVVVDI